MSYQALARKWRPRGFSEVVGQPHVVRALSNALEQNRIHHAFLLTGTRGVGKTTLARILAKALNCEQGLSANPCGVCSVCEEVDQGRFIDLVEIDAASNTGVDNIRELLDNVQYNPTRGQFKVYLIDEVHMLSKSAFNALLKTLEEPPPYVKFVLATTDPQKLPITILSRCIQFSLKQIPANTIAQHLRSLTEQENVQAEDAALQLIAESADGSLRDALSLLDQAIAFCGQSLTSADVSDMLGTVDRVALLKLLQVVVADEGANALEQVDALAALSPDYDHTLARLAEILLQVAVQQVTPNADDLVDENIIALAAAADNSVVQLLYDIALRGRRDLHLSLEPSSGFKMTILRMLAFQPRGVTVSQNPQGVVAVKKPQPQAELRPAAAPPAAVASTTAVVPTPAVATAAVAQHDGNADWKQWIQQMSLHGIVKQLALHCILESYTDNQVTLRLDSAKAHLTSDRFIKNLETALCEYLGKPIVLKILSAEAETTLQTPALQQENAREKRQQEAEHEFMADPAVQALQDEFGATVITTSIKPV